MREVFISFLPKFSRIREFDFYRFPSLFLLRCCCWTQLLISIIARSIAYLCSTTYRSQPPTSLSLPPSPSLPSPTLNPQIFTVSGHRPKTSCLIIDFDVLLKNYFVYSLSLSHSLAHSLPPSLTLSRTHTFCLHALPIFHVFLRWLRLWSKNPLIGFSDKSLMLFFFFFFGIDFLSFSAKMIFLSRCLLNFNLESVHFSSFIVVRSISWCHKLSSLATFT